MSVHNRVPPEVLKIIPECKRLNEFYKLNFLTGEHDFTYFIEFFRMEDTACLSLSWTKYPNILEA